MAEINVNNIDYIERCRKAALNDELDQVFAEQDEAEILFPPTRQ
jgi:hypothetical protein